MFIDGWFVATKSPPPGTRSGGGDRQEAENLLPQEYMTQGERDFQSKELKIGGLFYDALIY